MEISEVLKLIMVLIVLLMHIEAIIKWIQTNDTNDGVWVIFTYLILFSCMSK